MAADRNRLWESAVDVRDSDAGLIPGRESCADFAAGFFAGIGFPRRMTGFRSYHGQWADDVWSRALAFSLKACLSVVSFDIALLDAKHQRSTRPHPELRFLNYFE